MDKIPFNNSGDFDALQKPYAINLNITVFFHAYWIINNKSNVW